MLRGHCRFGLAEHFGIRQELAVQIGRLENIAVHYPKGAYAHPGEQVDDVTAQTAAADHQDMLALQQQALFFGQGRGYRLFKSRTKTPLCLFRQRRF